MQILRRPEGRKIWIIGLFLVVIFVIFMLPYYVSEPWIKNGSAESAVPKKPDILIPSVVAEKTEYRRKSQSILATIISTRDELQNKSVEKWAEFQFQQSIDLIAMGDNQYSNGNYDQALNSYRQTLTQLQQLQRLAEDKLEEALSDAEVGIESSDPSAIIKVLNAASLALAIAPDNSRSQRLNERASKFASFVEVLQQADKLFDEQQYQAAKKMYQRALIIDPNHQRAKTSLIEVDNRLNEKNFLAYMSTGYAALDSGDFEQALSAFERAGAIYINDPSVTQAIVHVSNRRSQIAVNQKIAEATELEDQEKWQQARLVYQSLLKTDPTLIQAQTKLITANSRANLDREINLILNDSFTLAHEIAYKNAQKLLTDAEKIGNPGSRLQHQIQELRTVIKKARIAVDVVLESDNLTQVTVFRAAKLGAFQRTTVALFPGHYIASGNRKGYRDVRVEFTVEESSTNDSIHVSCTEKI